MRRIGVASHDNSNATHRIGVVTRRIGSATHDIGNATAHIGNATHRIDIAMRRIQGAGGGKSLILPYDSTKSARQAVNLYSFRSDSTNHTPAPARIGESPGVHGKFHRGYRPLPGK